ncbi:MAG: four helix bundle protein [Planctomycetes bacterium]|nr:four helix bundle protein [Planctomycetota bacterium]MCH7601434.1 four helix bundle protein [Planctomycetota bacterium]
MGRLHGDLAERTFDFSLSILKLADELPQNNKGWILGKQVIRSGTSIGANIREANHASSNVEFAHKCNIALKEAAETEYWLELCEQSGLLTETLTSDLLREVKELISILNTIVKRTRESLTKE